MHDTFGINSISGPEIKEFPKAAQTKVFSLMERYIIDLHSAPGFLMQQISGYNTGTGPSAMATMLQSQIVISSVGGVTGFLVSFLLEHLTKVRLRDFLILVLSVWLSGGMIRILGGTLFLVTRLFHILHVWTSASKYSPLVGTPSWSWWPPLIHF